MNVKPFYHVINMFYESRKKVMIRLNKEAKVYSEIYKKGEEGRGNAEGRRNAEGEKDKVE